MHFKMSIKKITDIVLKSLVSYSTIDSEANINSRKHEYAIV